MTATRHPTESTSALRSFATRWPKSFAVLAGLIYIVPPMASWLLTPKPGSDVLSADPVLFAGLAWRVLVPIVLLTALRLWRTAGFTRRPAWVSLGPFLPMAGYYGLLAAVPPALLGAAAHGPEYYALAAMAIVAVAFGDEATFRGVVLQTLLPRGIALAVVTSSVLWGAHYLAVMASGFAPDLVGLQALHMAGMGFGLAAAVVVTRTIWPAVFIDAVSLIPTYVLPRGSLDAITIVVEVGSGVLVAVYGIWLLRRQSRQRRPGAVFRAPAPGASQK